MTPALATLVVGIIVGYLAQRSRMCFIGGLRDFILVRDNELLKGVIAFFVTAWLAFSVAGVFGLVDWQAPKFQGSTPAENQAIEPVIAVSRCQTQLGNATGCPNLREAWTPTKAVEPISWQTSAQVAPAPTNLAQSLGSVGWPILLLTVGAGVAIGLFSTLANGCPTRQHVLAAQGMQDSLFYLAGFYLGVIFYYLITKPLFSFFI
ncbi:MAG: hypothetical protein U0401_11080 [Anaerolineae bacterium]